MKFEIENNVITSYKRLSYDPWYAFAEFVDNSTQSYFDNKKVLDKQFAEVDERLTVAIDYNAVEGKITISDNSIGMNKDDLVRAFKVGQPPSDPNGRSKYGLGMKTAACWFGNKWCIKTKKLGEDKAFEICIDVDEIANKIGEVILNPKVTDANRSDHYTILTINSLNRKFVGRTLGKIKDYLSSIYRFDISEGTIIKWNGNALFWKGYLNELHITTDGVRFRKEFEFEIREKVVKGWVGVLGKGYGSRRKAGFSIVQNKRVIENNYKPVSIFGDQEDGGNDLINQRVIGELSLDKFAVSHTKDKIVWENDEEELLNEKLGEYCKSAKELALTLRFTKDAEEHTDINKFKEEAVSILESELKSTEINSFISQVQPYPEKILETSYKKTYNRVIEETTPIIEATVGIDEEAINVQVYFNEKSEFEPYVLTETTVDDNRLTVIINLLHPHVEEIESGESLTNFIRQCIYDGIAEWKAIKLRGTLLPYTIKFIKDGLLRVPFEIRQNKFV